MVLNVNMVKTKYISIGDRVEDMQLELNTRTWQQLQTKLGDRIINDREIAAIMKTYTYIHI